MISASIIVHVYDIQGFSMPWIEDVLLCELSIPGHHVCLYAISQVVRH